MDQGFDTVVRLPFDERFADRLNLDEPEWMATIRTSIEGISDQIILLLGMFEEVLVQDRLAETTDLIRPQWADRTHLGDDATR